MRHSWWIFLQEFLGGLVSQKIGVLGTVSFHNREELSESWARQSPTDPLANTHAMRLLRLVGNCKRVHYRDPVSLTGSLPRASTDHIPYVILWPLQWALFSGHMIYFQGCSERLNPGLMKACFRLDSPLCMGRGPQDIDSSANALSGGWSQQTPGGVWRNETGKGKSQKEFNVNECTPLVNGA